MKVTHRVKSARNETVGFILEGKSFINKYIINKYIDNIVNISTTSSGVIRSKNGELPEITTRQWNQIQYEQICKKNPFKRDCQELLLDWKHNDHTKVLQVEGTRQVGKTTEIKKFGYKHYEQVIYVNLASDTYGFVEKVVNNGISILAMDAYCKAGNLPDYIDNSTTLLIIDEIQISSKVYNSIRDFRDNLECDIIVTGSYLGQLLNREFFQPAGTVKLLRIEPMSFREVCRVFSLEESLMSIDIFGGSPSEQYNNLYNIYNIYRQIGGYPDIVKEYVHNRDIDRCLSALSGLLELFKKESASYFKDERDVMIFEEVYKAAAQLLCNDKKGNGNKTLSEIASIVSRNQKNLVSRDEINRAISWLYNCKIIWTCDLFNNGDIKDIIAARKIYFNDCGIANIALKSSNYPESITQGALTENFVYCELSKLYTNFNTSLTGSSPCSSTYGTYELDFVIVDTSRNITGIEVKTQDGTHKSLDLYLSKKFINRGILAKTTKGRHSGKFDTIPIFAVGCRYPFN